MLSFKEFLLATPDDLGPAEAQAKYTAYQARYYGNKTVEDFEANKNKPE